MVEPNNEYEAVDRGEDPPRTSQALLELGWVTVVVTLGLGCLLSWTLPQPKPDAVWGRLNYWQTVVAVVLTAVLASVLVTRLVIKPKRCYVGFRICAIWFGIGVPLVAIELCCLLLPSSHLVNPWWVMTSAGIVEGSPDLLFERPPHLKWTGLSTGSIALELGQADPYARMITFETDFEGFRNGRDIQQAELIFIGDSFTEAGNIPEQETFVQRVAQKLDVVARNLGRMNYGPSQELIVLKRYGLKCQPKIVVWQICERNDLIDEYLYQMWIDEGAPKDDFPTRVARGEVWKLRSPTYRLFQLARHTEPWPYRGEFRDAHDTVHHIFLGNLLSQHQRPAGHPGWPILESALRKGTKLLQTENIKLLIVLIPMKLRVMGPFLELSDVTKQHLSPDWDLPKNETISHYLAERCDELAVHFLDTTPTLRKASAHGELVYLPLDSHLSSRGHTVVAEQIAKVLAP